MLDSPLRPTTVGHLNILRPHELYGMPLDVVTACSHNRLHRVVGWSGQLMHLGIAGLQLLWELVMPRTLAIAFMLATAVSAAGNDEPLSQGSEGRGTEAKNLRDALERCRKQLEKDGSTDFAALVTEQRIKDAIKRAVADYEAWLNA